MFGRRKMYKQGMADALRANEAFAKKQEEAIAFMREEVRNGNKQLEQALSDAVSSLKGDIIGLYRFLSAKEKAAFYHLSDTLDIKTLDDTYKNLLLAMLSQLAYEQMNEGIMVTREQQAYNRSVKNYLGITSPQTSHDDLSVIGDIDSTRIRQAFLQVALEFFYLQEGEELSESQEEFLNSLNLTEKKAAPIEESVSRLFNSFGPEGVAEKYGYVPEVEISQPDNSENDAICEEKEIYKSESRVFDDGESITIDEISEMAFYNHGLYIETINYIMFLHAESDNRSSYGSYTYKKILYSKRVSKMLIKTLSSGESAEYSPSESETGYIDMGDEARLKYLQTNNNSAIYLFLTHGIVSSVDGDDVIFLLNNYTVSKCYTPMLFKYNLITDERIPILKYNCYSYDGWQKQEFTCLSGKYLAFCDVTDGLQIANLETGKRKPVTVKGNKVLNTGSIRNAMSICNDILYFVDDGSVYSCNLINSEKTTLFNHENNNAIQYFSIYSEKIMLCAGSRCLFRIDLDTAKVYKYFEYSDAYNICVAMYPDGVVYTSTEDSYPLILLNVLTDDKRTIAKNCGYPSIAYDGSSMRNTSSFIRIGNALYVAVGQGSKTVYMFSINNEFSRKMPEMNERKSYARSITRQAGLITELLK